MRERCFTTTMTLAVTVSLADAGGPAPFTEEAIARGIQYNPTTVVTGHGMAFADLDDDGDPDYVAVGGAPGVGLFENDGVGYFTNRSNDSGIGVVTQAASVLAVDIDRDGDLDLLVGRFNEPNLLLRNDGDFVFADISEGSGFGVVAQTTGLASGDYDGDGYVDLYVSARWGPFQLFHNEGDGTFTDVTASMNVAPEGEGSYQSCFFDYDRDGDSDLLVTVIRGFCWNDTHSHLYENVNGLFIDVTETAGTQACVDAMSTGIGDFDNNRYLDVFVTNVSEGHALLMNQGDGTFQHGENASGTISNTLGWGACFFDYDHDGHEELYICHQQHPNRFYWGGGSWPCLDLAPFLGLDVGSAGEISWVCATADVDGDGDLDMALDWNGGPTRLFINNEGQDHDWIKFDILGENEDRWAIGAGIEIRAGDDWQVREVVAGSAYKAQHDFIRHFGVDGHAIVDEVLVRWPTGGTRTLAGFPTNQTWTIVPPDGLGDEDRNGVIDVTDFASFVACLGAGTFAPGCETHDFDGDADVDGDDAVAFIAAFDGPLDDCDNDGVADLQEILLGEEIDEDQDGVPDACQGSPADLNGDGVVGIDDLLILIAAWNTADPIADIDGSGLVSIDDLLIMVGEWSA